MLTERYVTTSTQRHNNKRTQHKKFVITKTHLLTVGYILPTVNTYRLDMHMLDMHLDMHLGMHLDMHLDMHMLAISKNN